ncbi:LPD7 domain-containing protein [Citrobacter portucalensis]
MQKSHRIWLAVPHEEKDDAINAHPRLDNGQKALEWDNEHRLWYARPGADLNKFERWMPRPHELSMNAEDPVTEFAQKLEEAGLMVKGLPVMDGSLQRVPTKQDRKGSKSGAYKAYLDGRPAGWYRDYRSADAKPTQWVFSGGGEMDPLARLHLRAHAQQTREDNARALELQYNRQAEYAARYVDRYPQATTNTYLTRKGVEAAPGIRINEKQELVIPFSNAHGDIRSYQRIPLTGGKDARILKDSEKTGNWFALGTPQNGKPLLFAEGYATAASIHEASGLPVLMTIDAGNMIAVGQNARAVWPDSQFIFCADNDHQLKNPQTGEPENKGILSATKAAELTNGEVIAPAFTPTELEQNLTDFNDLILSRGKDLARHLINVQLHAMGIETPFNTNSQTRNAFVEGGLVFTPVQETAMDNHESPDIAHISDNDIAREHTVSELAEATAAEKPATEAPVQPPENQASHKAGRETITLFHGSPAAFSAIDSEKIGLGQNLVGRGFYTDTSVLGVHYVMEEINHKDYHVYELEIPSESVVLDRWDNSTLTEELRARIREAGNSGHQQLNENESISRSELGNKLADSKAIDDTFLNFASSPQGMSILKEAGIDALKDNSYVAIINTDLIDNIRLRSAGGNIKAEMTQYIDKALSNVAQDASRLSNILQKEQNLSIHYEAIRSELINLTVAQNRPEEAERLTALLTHTFVKTIDSPPDRKTNITPLNRLYAEAIRSLDLNHDDSAAQLGRIIDSAVVNINPDQKFVAEPNKPEPAIPANEQNPAPTEPEQPQPADVRDEPSPMPPIESDVLIPDTQSNPDGTLVTSPDDIGQSSQSVAEAGSYAPLPDLNDYADIRAQMDDPQFGEWMHSQSDDLPHKPAQEQFTAQELQETDEQAVKPEAALHDKNAEPTAPVSSELPIPPQSPGAPLTGKKQEQAQTANADADMPELNLNWTKTAENEVNEADGLVYGPRRPEPLQREDLDKIIKALSTEEQRDNTVLYRLDGEDAFRDLGNRLEMCNGASQDKRRVLAALAVASRFYGGVVELTGSMEFKEQAMRLIIENDLDIRMKLPAQRAQLEALRQQMGTTSDSITTHIPTPDLNRQTPSPDAAPPQSSATAAPEAASSNAPDTPTPPASPNPVSQAQEPGAPQPAFSSSTEAVTEAVASKAADSIRVPEMPAEPAPSALKPGQSITAVLKNFGEATYENKEKKGGSFFIELQNRGGSHTYWGQDLRKLIENHKTGDVVTLTLNSRDSWHVPGEENERVKNNWSLTSASTGLAVAHDRPEQGQPLQVFPVDTFGRLTQQIRQAWPEYTTDLKLPPRLEERQFYLGEDRHPVKSPVAAASILPPSTDAPDRLIPVMASMDTQSNQLDLLLVQSAGEHLQGMVRLDGTLYPALATPTTDNSQLVINAITDDGPRFAGYGQAVNFEPDGTTRAAPQLMKFHLKGREEDTPLPARLYTPEKQADTLFQRLGFEQTWKQWDDARKPEGRQEKALHQEHSHSPGR